MSRRNRPSAFELSFGEPLPEGPPAAPEITLKRPAPSDASTSRPKRVHRDLPKSAFYSPSPNRHEIDEDDPDLEIRGEEPSDPDTADKPVRILNAFTMFDPKHRFEMVSLQALADDDPNANGFVVVGYASAFMAEGDEDEEDEEEDEDQPVVKLYRLISYSIDTASQNDPVWLETDHAWYILRDPSPEYEPFFRHFYTPRRATQLVISMAKQNPNMDFPTFMTNISSTTTILGRNISEDDILSSVDELSSAVVGSAEVAALKQRSRLVTYLLRGQHPAQPPKRPKRWDGHPPASLHAKALFRNLDFFVLQPENQISTHVTPLVAQLAGGHFGERLVVVGAPLPPPSKEKEDSNKKKEFAKVKALVEKAHRTKDRWRKKEIKPSYRLAGRNDIWLKAIDLDNETFTVGDIVLVLPRKSDHPKIQELPSVQDIRPGATIPSYFRFAQIIFLNIEKSMAHVRWFEHSSFTIMQEFGNPQQLFLNNICDDVHIQDLIEKVTVHAQRTGDMLPEHYFYNSIYDHSHADVVAIDRSAEAIVGAHSPPGNCPVAICAWRNELENVVQRTSNPPGAAYLGHTYHKHDFVEVASDSPSGLCDIGQIVGFPDKTSRRESSTSRLDAQLYVRVRWLGRMSDIKRDLPEGYIKDEKQLFMTDEEEDILLTNLTRPCFVIPDKARGEVEWLQLLDSSPHHFYASRHFPSRQAHSWLDGRNYSVQEHAMCRTCTSSLVRLGDARSGRHLYSDFCDVQLQMPLRTLDLFSGCGAFSLGMAQGAKFIRVTHAIEISPSAAKTFMRNHKNIKMYNNCANLILRHFIKHGHGHQAEAPTQLFDGRSPVPAPPKQGDIDLMIIGFPCQSHSGLNKFKKANDPKSNLILTALSYVDFLRPRYCYFENVRGFLQYSLDATQDGKHKTSGGITMGGLKFLIRALADFGYQYRFALLQAAHYGTPQQRVRFFLVASRFGHPLPDIPQPSHHFPLNETLSVNLPTGSILSPVKQIRGSQAHQFVTVDDAISDLPRFDWKHPFATGNQGRQQGIDVLSCSKDKPWCGKAGRANYFHPPKTAFQVQCRLVKSTDLQQYTKVLVPAAVARVVNVPLQARADYRSLTEDSMEWQMNNAVSAVAKGGYRSGFYGRLDPDGWFNTTVTNVNPTAKQSKILNPYCKRIVTIRELARSQGFPDHFVFEAIDNNLVTMHRQIGNAVPWPVSKALGQELGKVLYKKWCKDKSNAIPVD